MLVYRVQCYKHRISSRQVLDCGSFSLQWTFTSFVGNSVAYKDSNDSASSGTSTSTSTSTHAPGAVPLHMDYNVLENMYYYRKLMVMVMKNGDGYNNNIYDNNNDNNNSKNDNNNNNNK